MRIRRSFTAAGGSAGVGSLGYTQEIGTKKTGGVDVSFLYILLDLLFRILVGGLTALHENTFKECLCIITL